jgi:hypothetical protein
MADDPHRGGSVDLTSVTSCEDRAPLQQARPATTAVTIPQPTTNSTAPTSATTPAAPTTTPTQSQSLDGSLADALDERRADILQALESEVTVIGQVDRLDYDGNFKLAVTSRFLSPQGFPPERIEYAWVIIEAWGPIFGGLIEQDDSPPAVTPGVLLKLNDRWQLECPGEFMLRVAEGRAEKSDMDMECRWLR